MELKKYDDKLGKGTYSVVVERSEIEPANPQYQKEFVTLTWKMTVLSGKNTGLSIYKRFKLFEDNTKNRPREITKFVEAYEVLFNDEIPKGMKVEDLDPAIFVNKKCNILVSEWQQKPFVDVIMPYFDLNKKESVAIKQQVQQDTLNDEVPF